MTRDLPGTPGPDNGPDNAPDSAPDSGADLLAEVLAGRPEAFALLHRPGAVAAPVRWWRC